MIAVSSELVTFMFVHWCASSDFHFLIMVENVFHTAMCVQLMEANNRVMYADGVVHLI